MASLIVLNSVFYIQYMASGKAKRVSTGTESLQIAQEKLRQFESAQANGNDNPLPSCTPIDAVVISCEQPSQPLIPFCAFGALVVIANATDLMCDDDRAIRQRSMSVRGMSIQRFVSLIHGGRLDGVLHGKPRRTLKRTRAFKPA